VVGQWKKVGALEEANAENVGRFRVLSCPIGTSWDGGP